MIGYNGSNSDYSKSFRPPWFPLGPEPFQNITFDPYFDLNIPSLLSLFTPYTYRRALAFSEIIESVVQLYTGFARMPEQTRDHLDDTDKMLLGELAVKVLTNEQVSSETDSHKAGHDHDNHENIQGHDYNPLTATHGTLVKTDQKGNLVQNEKVSQTILMVASPSLAFIAIDLKAVRPPFHSLHKHHYA